MPTFQAFQNGDNDAGLGDLRVLIDGVITSGPTGGTSVTYGNDPHLHGVTVQLIGTGISGLPSSSWHITEIIAENSAGLDWVITGITDGDVTGTPTSGSFDANSLFQAEVSRGAPRLIFSGHNNTITGGPGNEGLYGWGSDGNVGTISAGTGNDFIAPNGGLTTVNLKHGHDILYFNFLNDADPTGNVATIHNYSTARDTIDIDRLTFTHLDTLPGAATLLPSDFHLGANHPHNGHEQVWYNPHTGQLWVDFFNSFFGEVKDELAVIFGHGHTHPHITAANIIYA
jgi:hypothetical protein